MDDIVNEPEEIDPPGTIHTPKRQLGPEEIICPTTVLTVKKLKIKKKVRIAFDGFTNNTIFLTELK